MATKEILKAILIGVVEGITEWLPISSTGHMILLNEWISLQVSEAFWDFFIVAIQLGAIMAVVLHYWNVLFPFSFRKGEPFFKRSVWERWGKIFIAMLPAAIVGIPTDDWIDEHLFHYKTVALALIVYGIWFLYLERDRARRFSVEGVEDLPWKTALLIGLFQVLALIPGTSRSGSTIIGAMILGVNRPAAVEFTFCLAVPVMAGASLLKLLKFGFVFTAEELAILSAGMVTAFAVSLLSIRFVLRYVQRHDFKVFGWYRIALGLAVLSYFHFA